MRKVVRFDKTSLRGFKRYLKLEQQRLASELEFLKSGVATPTERCIDDVDIVRTNMDRAVNIELVAQATKRCHLVCAALSKIEKTPEVYGACENENCSIGKISATRLVAIPWAEYCINCQEEADAKERDDACEASNACLDEVDIT